MPFSQRVSAEVNNGNFWEQARLIYRSPAVSTAGFTHVEGFVTFDVVGDTNPGADIAILIDVVQGCGSIGSRGPLVAIGSYAGLPGKAYLGVGRYEVPLVAGGGAQTASGLSLDAYVAVYLAGVGLGRVIDLVIDGALVAGATR